MSGEEEIWEEIVRSRTALERIRASIPLVRLLRVTLDAVVQADPTLAPEVENANAHLAEAAASIDRAMEVIGVRSELLRERLDADRREL